jgi:PEP-CTERM motif
MKIRHLIKSLEGGALVAGVLAFSTAVNAIPVTQLIHFDDASNGWKWYSTADRNFLFNPTNLQSSTLCADSTNGGNGSCLIEGTQTVLPLMTRPTNGTIDQGSTHDLTDASYVGGAGPGDNQLFDLDAFYFLLTGKGEFGGNYLEVTGTFADNSTSTAQFLLGQTYANVTNYDAGGVPAGALDWNTGYVATFDTLFDNVKSIQFTAYGSAQVRVDCVVATFDGTTTEPLSSFDGGCGGASVPEPSILALLGIGFLGMGAARKLKKH